MTFFDKISMIALCFFASVAAAQDYPIKPINFIVGFPPGGGADLVARLIGQNLAKNWSQQVIVINRPGADSVIGYESASRAAADGYTILLITTEFAINPSLYSPLPYNTAKDFHPISLAATAPYVLVIHPSVPAQSVKDLIKLTKAKPDQLTYASSGTGVYLASEMFKSMAGLKILRVPYKGGPQAVTDVIAGHVGLMFPSMPTGYPHVKAGKLRALAVTSARRSSGAPDVPTIAEAALPGYEANQWWGVVARAGTPPNIINRLNDEIVKIIGTPDFRARLAGQNVEATGNNSEQFGKFISAEIEKWAKVVKDSGARLN